MFTAHKRCCGKVMFSQGVGQNSYVWPQVLSGGEVGISGPRFLGGLGFSGPRSLPGGRYLVHLPSPILMSNGGTKADGRHPIGMLSCYLDYPMQ